MSAVNVCSTHGGKTQRGVPPGGPAMMRGSPAASPSAAAAMSGRASLCAVKR